jgi:hypothetical protein
MPPGVFFDGGVADSVGHQHFGGEALGRFPGLVRMDEHPAVAVVVNVDETRRDDAVFAVDRLPGRGTGESADGGDAVAGDGDVGVERAAPVPSMTVPPEKSRSYTNAPTRLCLRLRSRVPVVREAYHRRPG